MVYRACTAVAYMPGIQLRRRLCAVGDRKAALVFEGDRGDEHLGALRLLPGHVVVPGAQDIGSMSGAHDRPGRVHEVNAIMDPLRGGEQMLPELAEGDAPV